MRLAVITNTKMRLQCTFARALDLLRASDLFSEVTVFNTGYHEHAIALSATAAKKGFNIILSCGGDGTLNEVLNGYLQQDSEAWLASLPLGTANDFIKSTGLDGSIEHLLDLIKKKSVRYIDCGSVEYTDKEYETHQRYFLNIADIGLGGYVVEKVNRSSKSFGPDFTFLMAITEGFFQYKQSDVICRGDAFEWTGPLLSLAVANGKCFGSGLYIAPDAQLDDGFFDVTLIGNIDLISYLRKIRKLRKARRIEDERVHYFRTKKLTVEVTKYACALDVDGEYCGYAPVTFEILPRRIPYIMP